MPLLLPHVISLLFHFCLLLKTDQVHASVSSYDTTSQKNSPDLIPWEEVPQFYKVLIDEADNGVAASSPKTAIICRKKGYEDKPFVEDEEEKTKKKTNGENDKRKIFNINRFLPFALTTKLNQWRNTQNGEDHEAKILKKALRHEDSFNLDPMTTIATSSAVKHWKFDDDDGSSEEPPKVLLALINKNPRLVSKLLKKLFSNSMRSEKVKRPSVEHSDENEEHLFTIPKAALAHKDPLHVETDQNLDFNSNELTESGERTTAGPTASTFLNSPNIFISTTGEGSTDKIDETCTSTNPVVTAQNRFEIETGNPQIDMRPVGKSNYRSSSTTISPANVSQLHEVEGILKTVMDILSVLNKTEESSTSSLNLPQDLSHDAGIVDCDGELESRNVLNSSPNDTLELTDDDFKNVLKFILKLANGKKKREKSELQETVSTPKSNTQKVYRKTSRNDVEMIFDENIEDDTTECEMGNISVDENDGSYNKGLLTLINKLVKKMKFKGIEKEKKDITTDKDDSRSFLFTHESHEHSTRSQRLADTTEPTILLDVPLKDYNQMLKLINSHFSPGSSVLSGKNHISTLFKDWDRNERINGTDNNNFLTLLNHQVKDPTGDYSMGTSSLEESWLDNDYHDYEHQETGSLFGTLGSEKRDVECNKRNMASNNTQSTKTEGSTVGYSISTSKVIEFTQTKIKNETVTPSCIRPESTCYNHSGTIIAQAKSKKKSQKGEDVSMNSSEPKKQSLFNKILCSLFRSSNPGRDNMLSTKDKGKMESSASSVKGKKTSVTPLTVTLNDNRELMEVNNVASTPNLSAVDASNVTSLMVCQKTNKSDFKEYVLSDSGKMDLAFLKYMPGAFTVSPTKPTNSFSNKIDKGRLKTSEHNDISKSQVDNTAVKIVKETIFVKGRDSDNSSEIHINVPFPVSTFKKTLVANGQLKGSYIINKAVAHQTSENTRIMGKMTDKSIILGDSNYFVLTTNHAKQRRTTTPTEMKLVAGKDKGTVTISLAIPLDELSSTDEPQSSLKPTEGETTIYEPLLELGTHRHLTSTTENNNVSTTTENNSPDSSTIGEKSNSIKSSSVKPCTTQSIRFRSTTKEKSTTSMTTASSATYKESPSTVPLTTFGDGIDTDDIMTHYDPIITTPMISEAKLPFKPERNLTLVENEGTTVVIAGASTSFVPIFKNVPQVQLPSHHSGNQFRIITTEKNAQHDGVFNNTFEVSTQKLWDNLKISPIMMIDSKDIDMKRNRLSQTTKAIASSEKVFLLFPNIPSKVTKSGNNDPPPEELANIKLYVHDLTLEQPTLYTSVSLTTENNLVTLTSEQKNLQEHNLSNSYTDLPPASVSQTNTSDETCNGSEPINKFIYSPLETIDKTQIKVTTISSSLETVETESVPSSYYNFSETEMPDFSPSTVSIGGQTDFISNNLTDNQISNHSGSFDIIKNKHEDSVNNSFQVKFDFQVEIPKGINDIDQSNVTKISEVINSNGSHSQNKNLSLLKSPVVHIVNMTDNEGRQIFDIIASIGEVAEATNAVTLVEKTTETDGLLGSTFKSDNSAAQNKISDDRKSHHSVFSTPPVYVVHNFMTWNNSNESSSQTFISKKKTTTGSILAGMEDTNTKTLRPTQIPVDRTTTVQTDTIDIANVTESPSQISSKQPMFDADSGDYLSSNLIKGVVDNSLKVENSNKRIGRIFSELTSTPVIEGNKLIATDSLHTYDLQGSITESSRFPLTGYFGNETQVDRIEAASHETKLDITNSIGPECSIKNLDKDVTSSSLDNDMRVKLNMSNMKNPSFLDYPRFYNIPEKKSEWVDSNKQATNNFLYLYSKVAAKSKNHMFLPKFRALLANKLLNTDNVIDRPTTNSKNLDMDKASVFTSGFSSASKNVGQRKKRDSVLKSIMATTAVPNQLVVHRIITTSKAGTRGPVNPRISALAENMMGGNEDRNKEAELKAFIGGNTTQATKLRFNFLPDTRIKIKEQHSFLPNLALSYTSEQPIYQPNLRMRLNSLGNALSSSASPILQFHNYMNDGHTPSSKDAHQVFNIYILNRARNKKNPFFERMNFLRKFGLCKSSSTESYRTDRSTTKRCKSSMKPEVKTTKANIRLTTTGRAETNINTFLYTTKKQTTKSNMKSSTLRAVEHTRTEGTLLSNSTTPSFSSEASRPATILSDMNNNETILETTESLKNYNSTKISVISNNYSSICMSNTSDVPYVIWIPEHRFKIYNDYLYALSNKPNHTKSDTLASVKNILGLTTPRNKPTSKNIKVLNSDRIGKISIDKTFSPKYGELLDNPVTRSNTINTLNTTEGVKMFVLLSNSSERLSNSGEKYTAYDYPRWSNAQKNNFMKIPYPTNKLKDIFKQEESMSQLYTTQKASTKKPINITSSTIQYQSTRKQGLGTTYLEIQETTVLPSTVLTVQGSISSTLDLQMTLNPLDIRNQADTEVSPVSDAGNVKNTNVSDSIDTKDVDVSEVTSESSTPFLLEQEGLMVNDGTTNSDLSWNDYVNGQKSTEDQTPSSSSDIVTPEVDKTDDSLPAVANRLTVESPDSLEKEPFDVSSVSNIGQDKVTKSEGLENQLCLDVISKNQNPILNNIIVIPPTTDSTGLLEGSVVLINSAQNSNPLTIVKNPDSFLNNTIPTDLEIFDAPSSVRNDSMSNSDEKVVSDLMEMSNGSKVTTTSQSLILDQVTGVFESYQTPLQIPHSVTYIAPVKDTTTFPINSYVFQNMENNNSTLVTEIMPDASLNNTIQSDFDKIDTSSSTRNYTSKSDEEGALGLVKTNNGSESARRLDIDKVTMSLGPERTTLMPILDNIINTAPATNTSEMLEASVALINIDGNNTELNNTIQTDSGVSDTSNAVINDSMSMGDKKGASEQTEMNSGSKDSTTSESSVLDHVTVAPSSNNITLFDSDQTCNDKKIESILIFKETPTINVTPHNESLIQSEALTFKKENLKTEEKLGSNTYNNSFKEKIESRNDDPEISSKLSSETFKDVEGRTQCNTKLDLSATVKSIERVTKWSLFGNLTSTQSDKVPDQSKVSVTPDCKKDMCDKCGITCQSRTCRTSTAEYTLSVCGDTTYKQFDHTEGCHETLSAENHKGLDQGNENSTSTPLPKTDNIKNSTLINETNPTTVKSTKSTSTHAQIADNINNSISEPETDGTTANPTKSNEDEMYSFESDESESNRKIPKIKKEKVSSTSSADSNVTPSVKIEVDESSENDFWRTLTTGYLVGCQKNISGSIKSTTKKYYRMHEQNLNPETEPENRPKNVVDDTSSFVTTKDMNNPSRENVNIDVKIINKVLEDSHGIYSCFVRTTEETDTPEIAYINLTEPDRPLVFSSIDETSTQPLSLNQSLQLYFFQKLNAKEKDQNLNSSLSQVDIGSSESTVGREDSVSSRIEPIDNNERLYSTFASEILNQNITMLPMNYSKAFDDNLASESNKCYLTTVSYLPQDLNYPELNLSKDSTLTSGLAQIGSSQINSAIDNVYSSNITTDRKSGPIFENDDGSTTALISQTVSNDTHLFSQKDGSIVSSDEGITCSEHEPIENNDVSTNYSEETFSDDCEENVDGSMEDWEDVSQETDGTTGESDEETIAKKIYLLSLKNGDRNLKRESEVISSDRSKMVDNEYINDNIASNYDSLPSLSNEQNFDPNAGLGKGIVRYLGMISDPGDSNYAYTETNEKGNQLVNLREKIFARDKQDLRALIGDFRPNALGPGRQVSISSSSTTQNLNKETKRVTCNPSATTETSISVSKEQLFSETYNNNNPSYCCRSECRDDPVTSNLLLLNPTTKDLIYSSTTTSTKTENIIEGQNQNNDLASQSVDTDTSNSNNKMFDNSECKDKYQGRPVLENHETSQPEPLTNKIWNVLSRISNPQNYNPDSVEAEKRRDLINMDFNQPQNNDSAKHSKTDVLFHLPKSANSIFISENSISKINDGIGKSRKETYDQKNKGRKIFGLIQKEFNSSKFSNGSDMNYYLSKLQIPSVDQSLVTAAIEVTSSHLEASTCADSITESDVKLTKSSTSKTIADILKIDPLLRYILDLGSAKTVKPFKNTFIPSAIDEAGKRSVTFLPQIGKRSSGDIHDNTADSVKKPEGEVENWDELVDQFRDRILNDDYSNNSMCRQDVSALMEPTNIKNRRNCSDIKPLEFILANDDKLCFNVSSPVNLVPTQKPTLDTNGMPDYMNEGSNVSSEPQSSTLYAINRTNIYPLIKKRLRTNSYLFAKDTGINERNDRNNIYEFSKGTYRPIQVRAKRKTNLDEIENTGEKASTECKNEKDVISRPEKFSRISRPFRSRTGIRKIQEVVNPWEGGRKGSNVSPIERKKIVKILETIESNNVDDSDDLIRCMDLSQTKKSVLFKPKMARIESKNLLLAPKSKQGRRKQGYLLNNWGKTNKTVEYPFLSELENPIKGKCISSRPNTLSYNVSESFFDKGHNGTALLCHVDLKITTKNYTLESVADNRKNKYSCFYYSPTCGGKPNVFVQYSPVYQSQTNFSHAPHDLTTFLVKRVHKSLDQEYKYVVVNLNNIFYITVELNGDVYTYSDKSSNLQTKTISKKSGRRKKNFKYSPTKKNEKKKKSKISSGVRSEAKKKSKYLPKKRVKLDLVISDRPYPTKEADTV